MRILATLKNFTPLEGKETITRNLNRILDIVILDVNAENGTITFLHATKIALAKVKRELSCIGYPIRDLKIQNGKN